MFQQHSPVSSPAGSVIQENQPVRPSPSHSSCMTRVETLQLSQHWRIENFASLMKLAMPGHCLRSAPFMDSSMPEGFWQLCLYPGGKRFENANNVSLFLKLCSVPPTRELRMRAEYRFDFLNDGDVPFFSNINVGQFHAKPPKGGHSWGLRNIPKQKVISCLRSDGSLIISCSIELIPDINRTKCINTRELKTVNTREVSAEFVRRQGEAFENNFLTDCTLQCNGHLLYVNKFVLMVHSKVFRAMFSHESLFESKNQMVVIEDTDVKSLGLMLKYMYTGEIELNGNAEGVLLLAERYQMDELKELCEQQLCKLVDKNNIGEMLYLADLYSCKALFASVIQVLHANRAFVMSSPAWQNLKDRNPRLITEIMEKALFGLHRESPPPKRQRCKIMCAEPPEEDSN